MDTIEQKLKNFREALLDKDYPLGIDEILCWIVDLFDEDADIEALMNEYCNDYYELFSCAEKFYKVKDLVDEQFYAIGEDDEE